MKRQKGLTENSMALRILEREDNLYKHKMIRDILNMYSDEIRKALLNGERVQISKVGTIIPEVKVHRGEYTLPTCNTTNGNPPPYTDIRMTRTVVMRESMNAKLRENIKNRIFGLRERLFCHRDFDFLKEVGYVPEDAELPDEDDN